MARTIRFHLDECCDPAVAVGLRRRGIAVTTSQAAGLLKAADRRQAAYGIAEGRVILTHDADFLRLQSEGVPHAGIAFCHKDAHGIGEIVKRLVLLWESTSPRRWRAGSSSFDAMAVRFADPARACRAESSSALGRSPGVSRPAIRRSRRNPVPRPNRAAAADVAATADLPPGGASG